MIRSHRLLHGNEREALEQDFLPPFLLNQRWFGAKARGIRAVRILDEAVWHEEPEPSYFVVAQVAYEQGEPEEYLVPLSALSGPVPPGPVLARLLDSGGETTVIDALANPAFCEALLTNFGASNDLATRQGRVRARRAPAFAELRGDPADDLPAGLGPATSSNSLVYYGRRLLLKVFRRVAPGINPDYEIGRFLTERAGFTRTPRIAGALEYERGGAVGTLAILQQYIPGAVDGWEHALGELGSFYRTLASSGFYRTLASTRSADLDLKSADQYTSKAILLGRRTAEMHLALASAADDPAFAPEPATEADSAAGVRDLRQQAEAALTALRTNLELIPEAARAEAEQLLAEAPRFLARLDAVAVPAAMKIRCHGDYHLGQVLWTDGDFMIIDFEGEPTRAPAERRAKQSPLRDVAGMLRSFNYAAHAGLFAHARIYSIEIEPLRDWAEQWQRWTCDAFLREYLDVAAGAPFLPQEAEPRQELLRLFMLAKAFYELSYELNNRPDWARIPIRGLLALLQTH
jgi:trehalose synthase-fused probable maltokinase